MDGPLVRALEAAQKARPADILVIYLAGHGVGGGGQDADFYYLTCDARNLDRIDPELLGRVAVSGSELAGLISKVPAEKVVLVLDTCHADRAIDRLVARRDPGSSQARAVERLKDATGLHILAGCAANAASYEATPYGQGLLTYSLLLGMRGAALREEQYVDVGQLFLFAHDKVPELAQTVNVVQHPRIAALRGARSFDIGRVTTEDRGRIPLRPARPLVQTLAFMEQHQLTDVLGLGGRISERLRESSARGREAPLAFVEAREGVPAAYQLSGLYKIEQDQVTVTVRLGRGGEKGVRFELTGGRGQVEELAARVVGKVEAQLRTPGNGPK